MASALVEGVRSVGVLGISGFDGLMCLKRVYRVQRVMGEIGLFRDEGFKCLRSFLSFLGFR